MRIIPRSCWYHVEISTTTARPLARVVVEQRYLLVENSNWQMKAETVGVHSLQQRGWELQYRARDRNPHLEDEL